MNKTKLILAVLVELYALSAASPDTLSVWGTIRVPEVITFPDAGSFPGISGEFNVAINKHVFKIAGTCAEEISFDFVSPDLRLVEATVSYGYMIRSGDFMLIPGFALGCAHYIMRGKLVPDTSPSWFSFGEEYEKVEETKFISKISLYGFYRVTRRCGLGLFFEPFWTGQVNAGMMAGFFVAYGTFPGN